MDMGQTDRRTDGSQRGLMFPYHRCQLARYHLDDGETWSLMWFYKKMNDKQPVTPVFLSRLFSSCYVGYVVSFLGLNFKDVLATSDWWFRLPISVLQ